MSENINHPEHYQSENGIEVIDVIDAFTADLTGADAFYIGNAIKYILRHNRKGGKEDIDKAIWYLARYKRKYPSNNNPSPYKAMQEFNKALDAFVEDPLYEATVKRCKEYNNVHGICDGSIHGT